MVDLKMVKELRDALVECLAEQPLFVLTSRQRYTMQKRLFVVVFP